MRRLTILVLIIGGLYSGYWFVGANAVETGAIDAVDNARAQGWTIDYAALDTRGFPSRFDTTVDTLTVIPPDGLWSWAAPFMQVFALSYQPNRVIAAFPETQRVRLGDQMLNINADGLRASAGVKANADLSFDAATAEVGAAEIVSDLGWTIGLERALVAMRADPEQPSSYDIYLDADQLALPGEVIAQIDPNDVLAEAITRIVFDSAIGLDKPLDRHAFAGSGPEPVVQKLILNRFDIAWGDVALGATGTLDIDPAGVPDGRITFQTEEWREIIDLLVNAGAVDPGIAPTIGNVAQAMAQESGTLELPVTFQNGFMSLGPLPLGPAPRFR